MITPETIIESIVNKLNANKSALNIRMAVEGEENLSASDLTPPYIVVYSDFQEVTPIADDGSPFNLPVDIVLACVSTEKKNVKESFAEAFSIAVKALRLIKGEYELLNYDGVIEPMMLKCKDRPIKIGIKSAKISSVFCFFQYIIPVMDFHNNGFGDELIINGGFDDETGWNDFTDRPWMIQNGVAISPEFLESPGTPHQEALFQDIITDVNKLYLCQIEIKSVLAGGVSILFNTGESFNQIFNSVGIHSIILPGAGATRFNICAHLFTGVIDNVSCREVL